MRPDDFSKALEDSNGAGPHNIKALEPYCEDGKADILARLESFQLLDFGLANLDTALTDLSDLLLDDAEVRIVKHRNNLVSSTGVYDNRGIRHLIVLCSAGF